MNVKTGQLAIVIDCLVKENLGKICEVGKYYGMMSFIDGHGKLITTPGWWVHFPSGITNILGTKLIACNCPDIWLKPITGLDDDTLDETLDKPIDCEVLT